MIVFLESKILKPPKAGAKASKEAIEMWTEVSLEHNLMMMKLSQPLATCMQNLQQGNLAINLQITAPSVATGISGIFVPIDKWWRGVVVKNWNMPKMQLLPSTTHPHMHMSYFGSYVISGITISTT
ncbi:unnamed protein product [Brassica rapa subsp. trilocularis]